jgi:hypothetical protein
MNMQKQTIERWQNAARVLKALTPHERREHWDMGEWGRKTDCGTVACAAGHCGLDPWFRKRGFKLDFPKIKVSEANPEITGSLSMNVDDFFDPEGADAIFCNGDSRSVNDVIKEIDAHIKKLRAKYKARAEYGKICLQIEESEKEVEALQAKKAALDDEFDFETSKNPVTLSKPA